MHLIKATMIKALIAGAATTATVSAGTLVTVAVVEHSAGNYAEAPKEIESENLTFDAEAYPPLTLASQKINDDASDYPVDTTDNDHETDLSETAPDSMAQINNAVPGDIAVTTNSNKPTGNSQANAAANTPPASAMPDSTANAAADPGNSSALTDSTTNTTVNTDNSSVNTSSAIPAASATVSAPSAASVDTNPVTPTAITDDGNAVSTANVPDYHHTTSIYHDDGSLWRVEYYVEGQNLPAEYSDVTYSDKDTNSYTETVYRYDEENDVEVVVRTDTYENGELVSSEAH